MQDKQRLLLIEDDPDIVGFLKMGLRYEGFDVSSTHSGRSGLELARTQHPEVVLLDLMLPDMDGMEVCRRLRTTSAVPIIVISARGQVMEKVELLKLCADDYLVKPFEFEELLARIRAILRRSGTTAEVSELRFMDLSLREETREVTRGSTSIALTPREFDLLRYFLLNPRRVLTREAILRHIWGDETAVDSNVLEVYVGLLRRKLGAPSPIQTARGVGYSLREPQ